MKLRILHRKYNSGFLQHTIASIVIVFTKIPMTIIYKQALDNFINEINRIFSPKMGEASRTRRSIN